LEDTFSNLPGNAYRPIFKLIPLIKLDEKNAGLSASSFAMTFDKILWNDKRISRKTVSHI
jgi:hypothetical protein